jgi:3-hydroxyisobutyrate dehydrogenase-like beta-hydroxyacid dehydrogenase
MAPGSTLLDMSSSYAPATKKLAATLAARKLTLVDAPVSGGVKGAKQATLTIMFGGSADKFAELQPILATMGKMIQHVGETGAGHALKAINNYLSAASLYATSEAVMMAQKFGLDPKVALETINQSSGQSYSTHYKFPTFVLPRSFNSNFSLDLLLKDVKMVNQLAKELEVPTLLASVVEQVYQTAKNVGPAEQDHTEIFTFIEQITARGD